jgi:putative ABC transport system permease protein
MQATYIPLGVDQVALAAALIVVNGAISVALRIGLERSLLVASLRTIVQLLLIGLVLRWVFAAEQWYVVVALAAIMTSIAAVTATQRCQRRYPGIWLDTLLSIWTSSWLVTAYALFAVVREMDSWYQPQYAVPLMGMILGNTLNGVSLGLVSFTESMVTRRDEVETLLALGATRREAALAPMRDAIRTGMTPIINAMMVVGLVSLPGMMTGQLLSGVPPLEAVRYQIMIMFLVAAATSLSTVLAVLFAFRRLFTRDHQFRHRLLLDDLSR